MINVENYIHNLIDLLKEKFGSRLLYVGLQGSYLRGDATDDSDIDIMVIIDELNVSDLETYKFAIQTLEHFDKSCGFICSKDDLANWNPLEICHVLNTTRDYYGELLAFIPTYTEHDVRNFVKISVNNLYHEICHRFIHADLDKNRTKLPDTYRGVFFILQNLYYLKHHKFCITKSELFEVLEDIDLAVFKRAMEYDSGSLCNFQESFELLFNWCQEIMKLIS